MTPLLELAGVFVRFGGLTALGNVSMTLPDTPGISAIIGPNGAGKTTLFNVVSGLVGVSGGHVRLRGADISHRRPDEIFRAGLARTFQGVRLFVNLTLAQNVQLAAASTAQANSAMSQLGLTRALWRRYPSELTLMQQRLAEIARALSHGPVALLLDEPGAGLNPSEKLTLCEQLREIARDRDCRIVLVEHDMKMVMTLAETIWVMNFGTILRHGTPEEVQSDPAVIEAYLGTAADD